MLLPIHLVLDWAYLILGPLGTVANKKHFIMHLFLSNIEKYIIDFLLTLRCLSLRHCGKLTFVSVVFIVANLTFFFLIFVDYK